MIYLTYNEEEVLQETVKVPLAGPMPTESDEETYAFKVRSTVNQDWSVLAANDADDPQIVTDGRYATVTIDGDVHDWPSDGEYEYQLTLGEKVCASGLMAVGNVPVHTQYEQTITYKQYES